MYHDEEVLLRKQRVASLSRKEEEAGKEKEGDGECNTHSLTLMEGTERVSVKNEKKRDAKIERNCVGRRDEETREESLLARLHG